MDTVGGDAHIAPKNIYRIEHTNLPPSQREVARRKP